MNLRSVKEVKEIRAVEVLSDRALRAAVLAAHHVHRNPVVIAQTFDLDVETVKRWVREGESGIASSWDSVREELAFQCEQAVRAALEAMPDRMEKLTAKDLATVVDRVGGLLIKLRGEGDLRIKHITEEVRSLSEAELHARLRQSVAEMYSITEAEAEAVMIGLAQREAGDARALGPGETGLPE